MGNNGFQTIASYVGKYAPALATALGSPIAGVAVSLISNLFGAKEDDVNDILSKISADPEAAVKLKQLEINHQDFLAQCASQDYSTQVRDTDSARNMHIQLSKSGKTDWIVFFLAFSSVLMFALCIGAIMFCHINDKDHDMLMMMFSQLSSVYLVIVNFYYGSSKKDPSSQIDQHTEMLNNLSDRIQNVEKFKRAA